MTQVVLLKAHTHNGVEYAAGARLDINETDAAYLIEHSIAKPYDDQE